ncbi:MAG TPA: hypothetical protein VHE55_01800 [Fimbriimonadaceae bacterium]|nr:hypothetical protein [Fimbriimonadaceae bacterium]
MKRLLLLAGLAACVFASADDPYMRAKFQAKYDAADAALQSGDKTAFIGMCDASRFIATDIQKQHQTFAQFLKWLGPRKTVVESADTLADQAKTALKITFAKVVTEKGHTVTYRTVKTEEDTWQQVGDDWKLVGTRLTSNLVTRNGKTILSESEHVLTDWDRQYGRRSSSRHHGRSDSRS